MQDKKLIIGLVGSGKTTLYRKLNEEKISNAVEIELPQSCINDEKLKRLLFKTYLKDKNIDVIIAHPYYLPKNFKKYLKCNVEIEFLEISIQERIERIKKRSKSYKSDCKIFDSDFLLNEEKYFKKLIGDLKYGKH